jgi:hypothetical protein
VEIKKVGEDREKEKEKKVENKKGKDKRNNDDSDNESDEPDEQQPKINKSDSMQGKNIIEILRDVEGISIKRAANQVGAFDWTEEVTKVWDCIKECEDANENKCKKIARKYMEKLKKRRNIYASPRS